MKVIILYKDISKVINAIDNRLELRGRDSFGLIINLNSNSFDGDEYKTLDSTDVNASYHSNKKMDVALTLFHLRHAIALERWVKMPQ